MKQKFESILAEVSDKYIDVKPYLYCEEESCDDVHYCFPNKELRQQTTEVSKYSIDHNHFKHLKSHLEMIFVEFDCFKNQELNDFIDNNYDEIYSFCNGELGHNFSSISRVVSNVNAEQINYFRPYTANTALIRIEHYTPQTVERAWYDSIREYLKLNGEPIRGFVSIASQYYIQGYGRDVKKYIEIDRDRVNF